MMRSMFSGISGLKGFQSSMDVIGNNIANVNTVGFKVSRTTFQSMLNQTVVGAKSPEEGGRGGTNSMQIGLGSQIGSIGKIMTQGSFQNTGKKTDLGLQGDGFFVLSDGIQNFYSRSGDFQLDESGSFIQPSTGLKLQGWLSKVDPKTGQRFLDLDKPPSDLYIAAGMTMPAKATSSLDLGGNLNTDVGIEPLTINVKNPNDPTKSYKVRFTFEKMSPFDTEKLFSGSTIKYTWNAEIVDWNADSPSELPDLNYTVGMVELNQFGQVEKFYRYETSSLEGETTSGNFTANVINGNASQTWFNYSPTGGAVEDEVKDVFDANDDGILDKIITQAIYNVDVGQYTIQDSGSTFDATGRVVDLEFGTIKPASGDKVNVAYYAQEDQSYLDTKTKYNLSGPILDSEGTEEISEVDILVYGLDATGAVITGTALTANTDYTYDANTGTVNIINQSAAGLVGAEKIRVEYCSKDSFNGDGTKSSWQLTKKARTNPFTTGKSTNGNDSKVDIDMQFTINESDKRIEFRTNYPIANPEYYSIEYANPNNPMEFNTVDVVVGNLSKASVSIPKTGEIKFFDKNDTQNYVIGDYDSPKYSTSTQVFDSLGKPYTVFLEFQKLKTNQWAWRATEETGIPISYVDGNEKTYTPSPNDLTSIVGGIVEFDSGGRVSALKAIRQNGMVEDDIDINRIKFDPGAMIDDGAAPPPEEGANAVNASIDFSELVQFSSEFSTSVTYQNGNSMGVLQNFAINQMGEVMGTFSNGKSDVLGQIALAIFNNPSGLNEVGNTLYQISANSGVAQVGLAGSGGRGTISPGVLEMSNVDLAEEFTGMVIVQRAFQANARTVTTVDQILQELVNLKR
ncbi:MAG: flagellar hook-basal body complex protein [Thermotogota bacterium]|nr:flagellar hook-basal body complex protein [Thermotogota bacterium]